MHKERLFAFSLITVACLRVFTNLSLVVVFVVRLNARRRVGPSYTDIIRTDTPVGINISASNSANLNTTVI
jgi:hypothetical protein